MQQVGKYQLIRKLATGGMAEVFLAKAAGPMGFEKTLVLKRILPHLAEEPAFVEMFLSEAKLAAQLTHPHIVQIFDFGEADGAYFLAMEYIDGPNLRTLVKRASAQGLSLPPAVCARLIADACEGLAFAHDFIDPETGEERGLIHRDISPDNILLSRQGAVKVVDFGIAKAGGQSHKTQSGVIKGKLAYMPPEQLRAQSLDRRVDVYALGVVLYELLTAHKPFEADTDVSLMQAILFEPSVPAVQFRPDLPESLQRILDRALAKDREQRYPDCLSFQSDLEEFILSAGKPVTTQQLAQLIAQVASSTDHPVPTPRSGTPRSGPKHTVTPIHTPPPPRTKTDVEAVHEPGTVKTPRPQAMREGADETRFEGTTRPPRENHPSEQVASRVQKTFVEPRGRGWLIPALVGGVLLAAGGGFVLWRKASGPEPQGATLVVRSAPPSATPPSTESPPSRPLEPSTDSPGVRPQDNPDDASTAVHQDRPSASADSPSVPTTPPSEVSPNPTPQEPDTSKSSRPSRSSALAKSKRSSQVLPKSVLKGTLEFRIRPYATVFVNGKELGDTPMPPVELPAGHYTVKLVNKSLSKTVIRSIEVKPDQPTLLKANLIEE